jgi:hypothetical protein
MNITVEPRRGNVEGRINATRYYLVDTDTGTDMGWSETDYRAREIASAIPRVLAVLTPEPQTTQAIAVAAHCWTPGPMGSDGRLLVMAVMAHLGDRVTRCDRYANYSWALADEGPPVEDEVHLTPEQILARWRQL